MRNQSSSNTGLQAVVLIILVAAILAGMTWANYRFALSSPGGNDFVPRWLGTRLFLTNGIDPYSEQATLQIQRYIFGRPARPSEDQSLFVYPFYSIFVFAPFSLIEDFDMARAVWMTVLEVSVFVIAGLSISLARWRISRSMLVLLMLFTALWYHSVRPIVNGNPSVLVALFLTLAFFAIYVKHDVWAGFLLALSTIKPQMVVLVCIFVLLWAVFQRRWLIVSSFFGSLGLMVFSTMILVPNWPLENLGQLIAYPQYTMPGSPGAILAEWLPGVGSQLGWVITIFSITLIIVEWYAALRNDFSWFFWAASLTLVLTNLIGIRTATANYIALLPALILVFATWTTRWGSPGRWITIFSIFLLFFGLWGLFLATVEQAEQPVQHPIMFFPLPVFLLIGLYWARWWVVRPQRMYIDELAERFR